MDEEKEEKKSERHGSWGAESIALFPNELLTHQQLMLIQAGVRAWAVQGVDGSGS